MSNTQPGQLALGSQRVAPGDQQTLSGYVRLTSGKKTKSTLGLLTGFRLGEILG